MARNLGIGARQVRQPALEQGQIDISPEYVGSGLGYYDKAAPTGERPDVNRQGVLAGQGVLADKKIPGLRHLTGRGPPTPPWSARTRRPSLKLAKMSDLAAVQGQIKWGLTPDCEANPLCKDALESYGITFPQAARDARGL